MILPKEIDPVKAAKAMQVFEGELPFGQFERMQGLAETKHPVRYRWSFEVTDKGQVQALLKLQGQFLLICQRCQQPVNIEFNEVISMQLAHTEQEAEKFPLSLQPIFINAEGLCNAYEIIEDELILALPMIAMHTEKDCAFSQNKAYYAAQDKTSTYKPFANLSKVFDSKE